MSSQIVTFNPGHPVAVAVSDEDAVTLGLERGSKLAVSIEPNRIVLTAVHTVESTAPYSETEDPLAGLLALARKGGGLEDDLSKMRREEDAHMRRKYGW
jgi:hypothetical protein